VHGARGYSEQPRWSPDGRRLAFWTSDGGEALDLVVLDGLDGTPRIVQRSTRYPNGPSWSPDSKRLVTNALDPSVAGAGFVYSPRILSIIDVETGAAQRLPTNGLNPVFAAWSPAADLIAFWGEGFDPETGIYVMAADGTGLRLLANEPCEYGFDCFTWIDWSPAGDAVVYSTGGANKDVWTVSVDDGGSRRVSSGSINATNPAFSPDGSLIAWFQSTEPFGYGPPGVGSIVVAAADGSKRRALTGEARIPLTTPRWAPDAGSVIVPVLGRDSDTPDELGIFPVEGGAPQLVSLQGSVYSEPSWQRQP
ncbi:MAG TPA: hypothetical protein VGK63_09705, partial [Candidatus Limnocylindrales bacterium]